MALSVPKAPGFSSMLKEGTKYFSGIEEAVVRNIEACCELSHTLRSAFGPKGLNKMIINHLEKLFVTSDAATILREMEVQHPAARLIVQSSQMMEQEVYHNTNYFIISLSFLSIIRSATELIL
jgi:T-complex protein 1 subunit theta